MKGKGKAAKVTVSCSVRLSGQAASGRVRAALVRGGRVVASDGAGPSARGAIRLRPGTGALRSGRYTVRVKITVDGKSTRLERRVRVG